MKQTILNNMIILTVIAVLVSAVFTTTAVYTMFNNKLREELENSADFFMDLLDAGYNLDELLESDAVAEYKTRITLIAENGEVLFDNQADIREMENHLHREERFGKRLQKAVLKAIEDHELSAEKHFTMRCAWTADRFCGLQSQLKALSLLCTACLP